MSQTYPIPRKERTDMKNRKRKDANGREEVFIHVATDRDTRSKFRAWCKEQNMTTTKAVNTLMKIVCSKNFRLKENGFTLSNKRKVKK